jgi:GTPase
MPVVAIVGRPNVGKSSLLNALAGRRISIVQDSPGVTRDRISVPIQIDGRWVELVDTGGFGYDDPDQLTEHIRHQIDQALARADLVLLVVDSSAGLVGGDQEIAALLRRQSIKVVLVANKTDGERDDAMLGDFASLGIGTPIGVSATTGRNIDRIFDLIAKDLDLRNAPTTLPPPQMHVAVVGKRNAGKSTLVNAIATLYGEMGDRVIVSEVPGTTRDSIDVRFQKDGQELVVIDTAGVRKKKRMVADDIAFYSFHRAQRSIRRADVVLLLIDGTEPVSEPDRKLASYIVEQYKPVILVVNKWDKAREMARARRAEQDPEAPVDDAALMAEFGEYLTQELGQVSFAPVAFITAKDGRNVQAVLDLSQRLFHQATMRLTTGRLNAAVRQILEARQPSTHSGRRAKVFYVTQVDVSPPTIVLFVNNPSYFDQPYQRFIINQFRELLPFAEVPIKLVLRGRQERATDPSLEEEIVDPVTADPPARPRKPVRHRPGRQGTAKPRRK